MNYRLGERNFLFFCELQADNNKMQTHSLQLFGLVCMGLCLKNRVQRSEKFVH